MRINHLIIYRYTSLELDPESELDPKSSNGGKVNRSNFGYYGDPLYLVNVVNEEYKYLKDLITKVR